MRRYLVAFGLTVALQLGLAGGQRARNKWVVQLCEHGAKVRGRAVGGIWGSDKIKTLYCCLGPQTAPKVAPLQLEREILRREKFMFFK